MDAINRGESAGLTFAGRSALIGGLYALEAAASFAVDVVLAASFGLTAHADALLAAWALPHTIGRSVFQSLTASFMGLFAGDEGSDRTYGPTILAVASLALPGAIVLSMTSVWWLPLTIPGASPAVRSTAVSLARILSWMVASLALAETVRAVHYREGSWGMPSLARLAGDAVAVGLLWRAGRSDQPVLAAWALVLGAGIEAALGLVGLPRIPGLRLQWRWPSWPQWRQMLSMVGAPIAGQSIRAIAGATERAVASLLPVGTLAAVSYSTRIIHSVERFVLGGFVISAIQMEARDDGLDLRRATRLVAWLGMWLAVVVSVLALPLARVLFVRGHFSSANAATLASVLRAYGLTILALAATRVPFALGYARKRPGVILGYFIVVSVGLSASVMVLVRLGVGLSSFGLGEAAGVWMALGWLYWSLLRPNGARLWAWSDSAQWLAAATVTLAGTWAARSCLDGLVGVSQGGSWLILVGSLLVSASLWLGSALALKVEEAILLVKWAGRRLLP